MLGGGGGVSVAGPVSGSLWNVHALFCFSVLSSDSDQLLMPTGTLGRVATMAEGKSPQDL